MLYKYDVKRVELRTDGIQEYAIESGKSYTEIDAYLYKAPKR